MVRALVTRALPDTSALPLRRLRASGSTNALFRLGDDLLVRLPRQPGGTATIEKESRWVPRLAKRLPVAVPEVVAVGEPGHGYPERWSVVRWIDGTTPAVVAGDGDAGASPAWLATDLADLVRALGEVEVPPEALADPDLRWYRAAPLGTQDEATRLAIEQCRGIAGLDVDLDAALAVWDEAVSLPGASDVVAGHWLHADIAAENLLVRDGRLAALLDFGALCVGDPTVDLIVAWQVLDRVGREAFRTASGADEAKWLRGRAWALSLALQTFPYYWTTMPGRCASRLAVVAAVLSDATDD